MAVWCEEPFTDGVGERSDEGVPHGAWQVLVVPPAPFKVVKLIYCFVICIYDFFFLFFLES